MAYASDIALPLSTHDRIAYVHIDVAGYHAILSSTSGENFYVNLKNDQQKPFKRAKVWEKLFLHCFIGRILNLINNVN